MKMGRPAWRREPELAFGAASSIVKLGWRTRQAPEIVASSRSRARRGKSSVPRVRPPVRPPSEEVRVGDAGGARAVLRSGRPQEDGGGLRADVGRPRGANVRHGDAGVAAVGG